MTSAAHGRQLVAERGLTPAAVNALIPLLAGVDFEALGEVKAQLLRFFSAGPWTSLDATALDRAVGPPPADAIDSPGGDGVEQVLRHRLDADLTLLAGWVDGTFLIDVETGREDDADTEADMEADLDGGGDVGQGPSSGSGNTGATSVDLGRTFAYGIVPEPTPNPRTLRFSTAHRPIETSQSHRRGDDTSDPRVAAVFAVADDVVDVLVAADFVAVSIARPGRWHELLEPVLTAVASGFAGDTADRSDTATDADTGGGREREPIVDVRGRADTPNATAQEIGGRRRPTRLEQAWAELGGLRAGDPDDLDAVLDAARDTSSARRQVAAQLLSHAPEGVAADRWAELVTDNSRAVRRATLDALVGAEREALRPLLEAALTDADAWVRWKALHGLVVLGAEPSAAAIAALDADPDFRVRLEAANAGRPSSTVKPLVGEVGDASGEV